MSNLPCSPICEWKACCIIACINKEIRFMNRRNLINSLHCWSFDSYCHFSQQDSMNFWSLSGNGSHNRHKMTLGVNWAMLSSERDGKIERGGEKVREGEREPRGLISDYNLALSKHKIFLKPKDTGMIKNKRIGIKHKELWNTPLVLSVCAYTCVHTCACKFEYERWLFCPLIKPCFTLVNGNSTELNVSWRGYSHRQALGHTHTNTVTQIHVSHPSMLSNKCMNSTPISFKNETFCKFTNVCYFCLCSNTADKMESVSLSQPHASVSWTLTINTSKS